TVGVPVALARKPFAASRLERSFGLTGWLLTRCIRSLARRSAPLDANASNCSPRRLATDRRPLFLSCRERRAAVQACSGWRVLYLSCETTTRDAVPQCS